MSTIDIDIDNRSGEELSSAQEDLIRQVLSAVVKECEANPDSEVCVSIVTNSEIHTLNKQYRNVDRPTDVLSFPMEPEPMFEGEPYMYGDIIISIQKAKEQATQYGHSLEREIGFLSCHGMLHLLGWDHMTEEDEKAMLEKQEKILKEIGLDR